MKPFVILVACLLTYLPLQAATETYTWVVHFDTDVDAPSPAEAALLRGFLSEFSPRDDLRLTITGHADLRGTNAYNHDLADRRCKSVLALVQAAGIQPTFHAIEVHGEEMPLVRGTHAKALEKNRRVEVIISKVTFDDIDAVHTELFESYLHAFSGKATEANRFVCVNKSTVSIPANALCDANGNPHSGVFRLKVIEALDPLAFFANKLSTVSDGELLESGGMMKIEAFDENDEPLYMREGSMAEVTLPTARFNPEMTLFVSSDGGNWTDTEQASLPPRSTTAFPQLPEERTCPIWMAPRGLKLPAKPSRPILTPRPTEPAVRAYESTLYKYPWWRPRKRKEELKLQEAVVKVYYKRNEKAFERYERNIRRYEIDSANFDARREAYTERLKAWEVECDSIHAKNQKAVFKSLERFKENSAECYEQRKNDAMLWQAVRDSLRQVSVDYEAANTLLTYSFSVTGFGWINCDRFMNVPRSELVDVVVQLEPGVQSTSVLILENINSVISLYPNTEGLAFARIPRSSKARIVSCYVEDERMHLATETFNGKPKYALDYRLATMEDLVDVFDASTAKQGMAMND